MAEVAVLGNGPGGQTAALLWIVRPDAHVAAVLTDPDPTAVTAALRRALAAAHLSTTTEEQSHGVLPQAR